MDNANRWDDAVAGFNDACRKQDARRAAILKPIHHVLRAALGLAIMPVTRAVSDAYPDSAVTYLGLAVQMGAHPSIVVRFRVDHADGSSTIVRLEDAVWVVTDDGQPARMGDELAALTVVLA